MSILTDLFPDQVVSVIATPEMWTTPVMVEEEALISRAVEKRRREFRAGRHCAHQALQRLGLPEAPILWDQKRAPLWPPGCVGSISHCNDYCLAACCNTDSIPGLGVDVEPLQPLKPGLERYILTENETVFLAQYPELPARLVFSAKESLYKCYYPLVKCFFGFHAVELFMNPDTRTFDFKTRVDADLQLPEEYAFHGGFQTTDDHLITGCYLIRR